MGDSLQIGVGFSQSDLSLMAKQLNSIPKGRSVKIGVDTGSFAGALGRINGLMSEFDKSLAASNARVLAFGASAGAIFAVNRALKGAVDATIEVESQLASINASLNLTKSGLNSFGSQLFKIANDTGKSFSQVAEAANELARQGLGVEDTLKRTSAALILARRTGLDAADSVQAITAALNSSNEAFLDAYDIVNKFVAVDQKFAVSSKDLAEAIKRVGSTAVDAGVSLDELIGLVTAAQQTTSRGGAVIGNAFKTIFTRVENSRTQEKLEALGIATKKMSGESLSAINILKNLATAYDNLTEAQQSEAAQLVGGVYQINILRSNLKDLSREYSVVGQATKIAANATDEAIRANTVLNTTLQAEIQRTMNVMSEFAAQVGTQTFTPVFKGILKGFNDITVATSGLGDKFPIDLMGGLKATLAGPGIITAVATIGKLFYTFSGYAVEAFKTISGIGKLEHDRLAIEQQITSQLSSQPELIKQLLSGQKTVNSLAKEYLDTLRGQALLAREISRLAGPTSTLVQLGGARVTSTPSGINHATVPVKALGNIPEHAEKQGALNGGYNPGVVKKMNVPGIGKVIYNSAETVKYFGGKQPAIMPPEHSTAGRNYRNQFGKRHGFDPYAANGMIPNFSAGTLDTALQKRKFKNVSFMGYPENEQTYYLAAVNSKKQKKGYGSMFMSELAKLADEHKSDVSLVPSPGSPTMSEQKLVDFYKRFGFETTSQDNGTVFEMIRKHKSAGLVPNYAFSKTNYGSLYSDLTVGETPIRVSISPFGDINFSGHGSIFENTGEGAFKTMNQIKPSIIEMMREMVKSNPDQTFGFSSTTTKREKLYNRYLSRAGIVKDKEGRFSLPKNLLSSGLVPNFAFSDIGGGRYIKNPNYSEALRTQILDRKKSAPKYRSRQEYLKSRVSFLAIEGSNAALKSRDYSSFDSANYSNFISYFDKNPDAIFNSYSHHKLSNTRNQNQGLIDVINETRNKALKRNFDAVNNPSRKYGFFGLENLFDSPKKVMSELPLRVGLAGALYGAGAAKKFLAANDFDLLSAEPLLSAGRYIAGFGGTRKTSFQYGSRVASAFAGQACMISGRSSKRHLDQGVNYNATAPMDNTIGGYSVAHREKDLAIINDRYDFDNSLNRDIGSKGYHQDFEVPTALQRPLSRILTNRYFQKAANRILGQNFSIGSGGHFSMKTPLGKISGSQYSVSAEGTDHQFARFGKPFINQYRITGIDDYMSKKGHSGSDYDYHDATNTKTRLFNWENIKEYFGKSFGQYKGPFSDGLVPNFARVLGSGVYGKFIDLEKKIKGRPVGVKRFSGSVFDSEIKKEYEMAKKLETAEVHPLFHFPKTFGTLEQAISKRRIGKEVFRGEEPRMVDGEWAMKGVMYQRYPTREILKPFQGFAKDILAQKYNIDADDFVGHSANTLLNPTAKKIFNKITSHPERAYKLHSRLSGRPSLISRVAEAIAKKGAKLAVVDPGLFEQYSSGLIPNFLPINLLKAFRSTNKTLKAGKFDWADIGSEVGRYQGGKISLNHRLRMARASGLTADTLLHEGVHMAIDKAGLEKRLSGVKLGKAFNDTDTARRVKNPNNNYKPEDYLEEAIADGHLFSPSHGPALAKMIGMGEDKRQGLAKLYKKLKMSAAFGATKGLYRADGLVPAFAREAQSVHPSLIKVGKDSRLTSHLNPDGLGVYNLRDEPGGLGQGINRAIKEGRNPKTYNVPNFSIKDRIKSGLFDAPAGTQSRSQIEDFQKSFLYSFLGGSVGDNPIGAGLGAAGSFYSLKSFLPGKYGTLAAGIGTAAFSGGDLVKSVANLNNKNNLGSESEKLKENFNKISDALQKYTVTLEELNNASVSSKTSGYDLAKLQSKLYNTIKDLPEEYQRQALSASNVSEAQEVLAKYTRQIEGRSRQLENAAAIAETLDSRKFRFGSLKDAVEKPETTKSKYELVASQIQNSLDINKILESGGAAQAFKGGVSGLKKFGISDEFAGQLSRINKGELGEILGITLSRVLKEEGFLKRAPGIEAQRRPIVERLASLREGSRAAERGMYDAYGRIGGLGAYQSAFLNTGKQNKSDVALELLKGYSNLNEPFLSGSGKIASTYNQGVASNYNSYQRDFFKSESDFKEALSSLSNKTFEPSSSGFISEKSRNLQIQLSNLTSKTGLPISQIGNSAIDILTKAGKNDAANDVRELLRKSSDEMIKARQELEKNNQLTQAQKDIALKQLEINRASKFGGGAQTFLDKDAQQEFVSGIYESVGKYKSSGMRGQGAVGLLQNFLSLGGTEENPEYLKLRNQAIDEAAQDRAKLRDRAAGIYSRAGLGGLSGEISKINPRKVAEVQIGELLGNQSGLTGLQGLINGQYSSINALTGGQLGDIETKFKNALDGSLLAQSIKEFLNAQANSARANAEYKNYEIYSKKRINEIVGGQNQAFGGISASSALMEKMMAAAGGYNAGAIRKMGNGGVIYNSAENVVPFMGGKVVNPPMGSLAGALHKKNFMAAYGVNPYKLKNAGFGDFLGDLGVGAIEKLGFKNKFEDFIKRRIIEQSLRYYQYGKFSSNMRNLPKISDITNKLNIGSNLPSGYGGGYSPMSLFTPKGTIELKNKDKLLSALNLSKVAVHEGTHAISDITGQRFFPSSIKSKYATSGADRSVSLINDILKRSGSSSATAASIAETYRPDELRAYRSQEKFSQRPLLQKIKEIFNRPYVPNETGQNLTMSSGATPSQSKKIARSIAKTEPHLNRNLVTGQIESDYVKGLSDSERAPGPKYPPRKITAQNIKDARRYIKLQNSIKSIAKYGGTALKVGGIGYSIYGIGTDAIKSAQELKKHNLYGASDYASDAGISGLGLFSLPASLGLMGAKYVNRKSEELLSDEEKLSYASDNLNRAESLRLAKYRNDNSEKGKVGYKAAVLSRAGRYQDAKKLITDFNGRVLSEGRINLNNRTALDRGQALGLQDYNDKYSRMSPLDRVRSNAANLKRAEYLNKDGTNSHLTEEANVYRSNLNQSVNDYNSQSIIAAFEKKGYKLSDAQKSGIKQNIEMSAADQAAGRASKYTSAAQYSQIIQKSPQVGPSQAVSSTSAAAAPQNGQPAGAESRLNVNLTMGGNVGVAGGDEEQQLKINQIVQQIAAQLRAEIDALSGAVTRGEPPGAAVAAARGVPTKVA